MRRFPRRLFRPAAIVRLLERIEPLPLHRLRQTFGVREMQNRIALAAKRDAAVVGREKAVAPRAVPPSTPSPELESMTTKPGRFCDSLPRPYVTQEPMQGWPNRTDPHCMSRLAGVVIAGVGPHRADHGDLVAQVARFGRKSEKSNPAFAVLGNVRGLPKQRGVRFAHRRVRWQKRLRDRSPCRR